jgi:hypothetical protein
LKENLTVRYPVTVPPPSPFAAAIAAANTVTVILTFTTASQCGELMAEQ